MTNLKSLLETGEAKNWRILKKSPFSPAVVRGFTAAHPPNFRTFSILAFPGLFLFYFLVHFMITIYDLTHDE